MGFDFKTFQMRLMACLKSCLGFKVLENKKFRKDRFLEEALELVQALEYTESEAHQMVRYVFNRPKGNPEQEVGGVATTLVCLCDVYGFDFIECAEKELASIYERMDAIRKKQAVKPVFTDITETDFDVNVSHALQDIKGWERETTVYDGQDINASYYKRKRVTLSVALEAILIASKFGLLSSRKDP